MAHFIGAPPAEQCALGQGDMCGDFVLVSETPLRFRSIHSLRIHEVEHEACSQEEAIPRLVSQLVPIAIIKKLFPICDPDGGGNLKKLFRKLMLMKGEWCHTDRNPNAQKYNFMLGF